MTTTTSIERERYTEMPTSAEMERAAYANDAYYRVVYTGDDVQVVVMRLRASQRIAGEVHAQGMQVFCVFEGLGRFTRGTMHATPARRSAFDFGARAFWAVERGQWHDLEATSDDVVIVSVYSWANHERGEIKHVE